MSKKMLIDTSHAEETRVVVLDGNRLEDFDVETVNRKQIKGNIYLAKVIRVEPSLQAAFVEYGGNRHGFLAFGEIHPDYYQIPVADRQKLLAMQAEAEAEAEAEANRLEDALATPLPELKSAPPIEGENETETNARNAAPLEIRPIAIHAAPPPEEPAEDSSTLPEEAGTAEIIEVEGPGLISEPLPEEISGDEVIELGRVESVAAEPEPEQVGGDGDDAAEARERRLRQRFLRNYKIQDVIHRRQIMLVQVVKEERGNKGAALTTYLSLAGRFSVLMPNSPTGGGVSRKITSQTDRRRLKETMAELDIPQGMGMIVRTAGANRPKPEIKRDCEYLLRLWDDIRDKTMESTAPALIYEEANLIKRAIRDVYTRDVEAILVDGEEGYKAAQDFMRMLMPANARKVQLWNEGQPLFSKYQVETQLDAMLNPVVQLRSGGYIVINQTEALVAIDVNSGRSTRERNVEDTALRTNLEAVDEVAKQLRMRDLAGLVVIDFIDMESRRNNLAVERRMKEALRHDRARIQVGAISHFGLMEMSRQRLRPSLTEASLVTCPHCGGMGHVRSPESAALHILRAIEDEGAKFKAAEIGVSLPPEIAFYLFNHKRERLSQIETRYAMRVMFNPDSALAGSHFRLERLKPQTALPPAPPAAPAPIRAERVSEAIQPVLPVAEEAENAETEAEPPSVTETNLERADRKRRRRRRGRREPGNHNERPETRPEAEKMPVEANYDQPSELDLVLEAALGDLIQQDAAPELTLMAALEDLVEPTIAELPAEALEIAVEAEPQPEIVKPKRAPRKRKPAAKAETGHEKKVEKRVKPVAEKAASSPEATDIPAPAIEAQSDTVSTSSGKPKRAPRKRKTVTVDATPAEDVAQIAPVPETSAEETASEAAVKPILVGTTETSAAKKTGWWRR